MEILACCVFAYWLVKHLPEIAAETTGAFVAALRGEESPAMAARRDRLREAGVDPAAGGAFRQFFGNTWRDFWLDQEESRRNRRSGTERSRPGRGWWSKVADAWDTEVGRRSAAWRNRNDNPDGQGRPVDDPGTGLPPLDEDWVPPSGRKPQDRSNGQDPVDIDEPFGFKDPLPDPPDWEPSAEPNPDPVDHEPPRRGRPDRDGPDAQGPDQPSPDRREPTPEPDNREPVRVDSTTGPEVHNPPNRPADDQSTPEPPPPNRQPHPVPPDERNQPVSTAVARRGIHVTTLTAGVHETTAIQRELDQATAEYLQRLAALSGRMNAMGEASLALIQFANNSTVMTRMGEAAEALAAARHVAQSCAAEVTPMLASTRREFAVRI